MVDVPLTANLLRALPPKASLLMVGDIDQLPSVGPGMEMQQYLLLQRNLVCTGITRGKKLVVVVGQRKALAIAVRNNKKERRFSGLLARLKGLRQSVQRVVRHTKVDEPCN